MSFLCFAPFPFDIANKELVALKHLHADIPKCLNHFLSFWVKSHTMQTVDKSL